jgi:ribosome biogenesis GTPase
MEGGPPVMAGGMSTEGGLFTGCAVLMEVKAGKISEERYTSYMKLQRELKRLEIKQNKRSYLEEKRRIKNLHKEYKRIKMRKLKER